MREAGIDGPGSPSLRRDAPVGIAHAQADPPASERECDEAHRDRRSPELQRALLQAGELRFDRGVSPDGISQRDAGRRRRHPDGGPRAPTVSEVAAFVAAVGRDEDVRRWCLLTLAGALRPGVVTSVGRWRIDPEAGALIEGDGPGAGPWHCRHPAAVLLPPCVLAEAATWTGAPWCGPTPGRLRRQFERHRLTSGAPFVTPSSLRRFVVDELWRRAPGLVSDDVAAWLGLRRWAWTRFARPGRPAVAAILRTVDGLLHDVDRQSGGALLRAGRGEEDKAG